MQHPNRPPKSAGVEMYMAQVNKVNLGLQLQCNLTDRGCKKKMFGKMKEFICSIQLYNAAAKEIRKEQKLFLRKSGRQESTLQSLSSQLIPKSPTSEGKEMHCLLFLVKISCGAVAILNQPQPCFEFQICYFGTHNEAAFFLTLCLNRAHTLWPGTVFRTSPATDVVFYWPDSPIPSQVHRLPKSRLENLTSLYPPLLSESSIEPVPLSELEDREQL